MTSGFAHRFLRFLTGGILVTVGQLNAAEAHYLETVKPLLTRACVSCHGPDHPKAELRLDTAADALKGGESGPAIVPGKPSESLLIQVLEGTHPGIERMPYHRPPLHPPEIETLRRWIADGAHTPAQELPGVFIHWSF
ncbi:MAG: hypothetical protein RIS24_2455, partial [Verrucomicrobiota bacterium]